MITIKQGPANTTVIGLTTYPPNLFILKISGDTIELIPVNPQLQLSVLKYNFRHISSDGSTPFEDVEEASDYIRAIIYKTTNEPVEPVEPVIPTSEQIVIEAGEDGLDGGTLQETLQALSTRITGLA